MNYCGLTYTGRRSANQDSYFCGSINGITVLAVADGMGGMKGGEVASSIAIDTLCKYLTANVSKKADFESLKKILQEAFFAADAEIATYVKRKKELSGMGTTLCCALIKGDQFIAANVGDSRLYLCHDGGLELITRDHTYLQSYIDQFGNEVPEEIQKKSHVLTRALNGAGDSPDIYPGQETAYRLDRYDVLYLCSDGLVTDKSEADYSHFLSVIKGSGSYQQLAEQLISGAYFDGSTDNCTVVVGGRTGLKQKQALVRPYPFPPKGEKNEASVLKMTTGVSSGYSRRLLLVVIAVLIALGSFLWLQFIPGTQYNQESQIQTPGSPDEGISDTGNLTPSETTNSGTAIEWLTGFGSYLTGSTVPFSEGEAITWARPEFPFDYFLLVIQQDGQVVREIKTENPVYQLNAQHGYTDGVLFFELYAVKNGEQLSPQFRNTLRLNYVSQ